MQEHRKWERMKILIVDDDKDIRNLVKLYLDTSTSEIVEAEHGAEALEKMDESIDLVLLDEMMPVMSGRDTCIAIRQSYHVPIIFLTAKSEEMDKYLGFTVGADDYITKPFNPMDLIARIQANVRRYRSYSQGLQHQQPSSQGLQNQQPSSQGNSNGNNNVGRNDNDGRNDNGNRKSNDIILGNLRINLDSMTVHKEGIPIELTRTEFSILEMFVNNRSKVFSIEQIYMNVWGQENILNAESTVSVHIRNLRKKIEDNIKKPVLIKTVWGSGYRVD